MTEQITRRGFFTMGLIAGSAVVLSQPALARGGPDTDERFSPAGHRKRAEKQREERRRAREQRRKERQKTKK
ncbi:MAG: hypothetical protein AAGF53_14295 [Pseudomonadota bacterium]